MGWDGDWDVLAAGADIVNVWLLLMCMRGLR